MDDLGAASKHRCERAIGVAKIGWQGSANIVE